MRRGVQNKELERTKGIFILLHRRCLISGIFSITYYIRGGVISIFQTLLPLVGTVSRVYPVESPGAGRVS